MNDIFQNSHVTVIKIHRQIQFLPKLMKQTSIFRT